MKKIRKSLVKTLGERNALAVQAFTTEDASSILSRGIKIL